MIKSIEIQNFLSHKKTKMTFGQGVNAIVGATDAGKSAIIQAFRWVVFNRPVGDGYRSNWGGTTKVTIYTENGYVTRVKSDSVNKYLIEINGSKLVPLTGFGTKVPDPVLAFLNMTETNLQTQMEGHYLLSKPLWSAGDVAAHFNKIAHLHKIDIGRKNISVALKRSERKIEADETEIGRLKVELKQYEDLDDMEIKIIKLEKIDKLLDKTIDEVNGVSAVIAELQDIDQVLHDEAYDPDLEKLIDKILGYQTEIELHKVEIDDLNSTISYFRELEYDIRHAEKFVSAEELIDSLIAVDEELEKEEGNVRELEMATHYLKMILKKEKLLGTDLELLEEKFSANMGEFCILCGIKFKKKKS